MIQIGKNNALVVLEVGDYGAYLDGEHLGKILLPRKYLSQPPSIGSKMDVFLYHNAQAEVVATTIQPKAQVGEFAYLEVTAKNQHGAFVDWGLDKDVLVPLTEQHVKMDIGHRYIVYIYIDSIDGRIVASSKIDKFLDQIPAVYKPQQAVDLIIANTTDLGFKAIVNHSHWGVLYRNEVFQRLSFGQYKKGYIKGVREDGKVDLSLQGGQKTRDKYAKIILNYLKSENGFAPVHDKSDPELISRLFGMSKKAFKSSIGGLFKEGTIRIENEGIYLQPISQKPMPKKTNHQKPAGQNTSRPKAEHLKKHKQGKI
ncbi:MAG: GntR family transcriptional regulator [Gammaproteobacteria bacterium CG22_combo_CG10-13_8_21_14_all_40_8]|nr:MAG: GntR family transcriptional regulator [Gammaproteobacteria bacterium CG22_combo_CG10-13_8_21_14_all_40_8]